MIHVALGFLSNMKFAFLPSERDIVERGYVPLFEALGEFPQLRADLFFSGYSELALEQQYPEVVRTVKRGLSEGRLRVSSNGYEHVSLPFVSHHSARKHLVKGVGTDRRVWGIQQPDGLYPSDCAWDPTMGLLLQENGIAWVLNHVWRLRDSCPGGLYTDVRDLDTLQPINILCAGAARIPMFFHENNNYYFLRDADLDHWFAELERVNSEREDDAIVCVGLDMETPLVLEVQGFAENGADRFRAFARRLAEVPDIRFALLGDYLRNHPPRQEAYLRHSPECHTNGSQKLTKLCEAAEHELLACEELMAASPGAQQPEADLERAWEHLLAAQCTDAYFTDPPPPTNEGGTRYPLSRVILAAMDHALEAGERAAALKRALLGLCNKPRRTEK